MAQVAAAIGGASKVGGLGLETVAEVQAADISAKSQQAEARSIEEQAAFDERQQRRQARLLQGQANAIGAASGIDISSGSSLLMELDRAKQSEIEAQVIRRSGNIAAQGKRYGARLARRSIPFTVAGKAFKAGSMLSGMMAGGGGSGG